MLPHTRRTDNKPDPLTAAAAATWSHADVWGTSQLQGSAAYAQFLYPRPQQTNSLLIASPLQTDTQNS